MLWVIIERIVQVLTLTLLIIMISITMTNNKSSEDFGNFGLKLNQYRQETLSVIAKNVDYVDGRINRVAENQDFYQVRMDQRVYIVEAQMKAIQADKKAGQKVIQNNINTNTNTNDER